ncbi:MAG: hypothetical protein NTY53_07220 [Kiritimatiellaeota bacterium]|nr:hypothetical protein [Kiritimatiellota bacterium]
MEWLYGPVFQPLGIFRGQYSNHWENRRASISSVRLEQAGEGCDDFEYLWLLRDASPPRRKLENCSGDLRSPSVATGRRYRSRRWSVTSGHARERTWRVRFTQVGKGTIGQTLKSEACRAEAISLAYPEANSPNVKSKTFMRWEKRLGASLLIFVLAAICLPSRLCGDDFSIVKTIPYLVPIGWGLYALITSRDINELAVGLLAFALTLWMAFMLFAAIQRAS